MKKYLSLLLVTLLLFAFLVSCSVTKDGDVVSSLDGSVTQDSTSQSNKATEDSTAHSSQMPNVKPTEQEKAFTLTVSDKHSSLYEPLESTYDVGEAIVVKTHLVLDTATVVELNGAKPISASVVKNESGNYIYNQYIFTMPAKHSLLEIKHKEGMGMGHTVSLTDENELVINNVAGMKMAGESYEIHTATEEIMIIIDGVILTKIGEAVTNSQDDILYYTWSFEMPPRDIAIEVIYLDSYEPTLWHLTFVNETGIEQLFSDSISGEYSHGDIIHITPNGGVLDKEIILKVNGKLLKETDFCQWQFTMPDRDITVSAHLVNTSWGEEYYYLNIVDSENYLSQAYDGYYMAGETITIVTKVFDEEILIDLWSKSGLAYERQEYAKEDVYEYTFVFTMPSADVTINVLQIDTFDD